MSVIGVSEPTGNYTARYTFLAGNYRSGDSMLPYFSIQMGVTDAIKDLVFAGELVPDVDQPVRIEELFQREIDDNRVKNEIVPYLEHQSALKFFNALTVVLLPVEGQKIAHSYPDDAEDAPSVGEKLKAIDVGPIQFVQNAQMGELSTWKDGFVCWNRDRVKAVVVDGQHRLSALKRAVGDGRAKGLKDSSIAVLIIVLDPRAGFKSGGPSEELPPVLTSCRRIFFDLNQHAREVPEVRRMLLDDEDPAATSMRSIISDDLHAGQGIAELTAAQRLPLCVIDWQSGQAKVDKNEFLVSLPTLNDVVAASLKEYVFPAHNYDSCREIINGLQSRIPIPESDVKKIRESIKRSEDGELPLPAFLV